MNTLSHGNLLSLALFRDPQCVSIYMPTFWGMDQQQGPIRLKNLVDEAHARLIARGMRTPAAAERLAPLRAMIDDSDLWRQRGGSLALFVGGAMTRRSTVWDPTSHPNRPRWRRSTDGERRSSVFGKCEIVKPSYVNSPCSCAVFTVG